MELSQRRLVSVHLALPECFQGDVEWQDDEAVVMRGADKMVVDVRLACWCQMHAACRMQWRGVYLIVCQHRMRADSFQNPQAARRLSMACRHGRASTRGQRRDANTLAAGNVGLTGWGARRALGLGNEGARTGPADGGRAGCALSTEGWAERKASKLLEVVGASMQLRRAGPRL